MPVAHAQRVERLGRVRVRVRLRLRITARARVRARARARVRARATVTVLHERGVLLLRLRVVIERVVATVQYDREGGALVGRADALVVCHRVERAVRGGDAAQALVRVRVRVRVGLGLGLGFGFGFGFGFGLVLGLADAREEEGVVRRSG